MQSVALIYSTFANKDDAKAVFQTLLDEKLVTCCNIMAPHTAVYPWKGSLAEETEVGVFFKAPESHAEDLMDRLRQIHPYELPCILKLEAAALTNYANWLACPAAKD